MRTAALVLAAALLVPAGAEAQEEDQRTTIVYAGTAIYLTAATGVGNGISLHPVDAATVSVHDSAGIVDPGGKCVGTSQDNTRNCPVEGIDRVYVRMFDGNDQFYGLTGYPLRFVVDGGPGGDHMRGGDLNDWIVGGDGNDWLHGLDGADLLEAGPGVDYLFGDAGGDDMRGGPGQDKVNYWSATGPVTADLDGARDDGAAGEGDVIRPDVEDLSGSNFSDRLTGNNGPNRMEGGYGFAGGGGTDLISGLGGNDFFVGGLHTFKGGDGVDTISFEAWYGVVVTLDNAFDRQGHNVAADVENVIGSPYGDRITGSGLPNMLRGGGGSDTLNGLGGNDLLFGDAGPDTLHGGTGTDRCMLGPQGGDVTSCP